MDVTRPPHTPEPAPRAEHVSDTPCTMHDALQRMIQTMRTLAGSACPSHVQRDHVFGQLDRLAADLRATKKEQDRIFAEGESIARELAAKKHPLITGHDG